MSTIVLRSVKGSPLSNTEVDANFSNLNTDKTQLGGTYSSGTANGVLYLSSSKVLTTGSALTFDGANLGVSGNATLGWTGKLSFSYDTIGSYTKGLNSLTRGLEVFNYENDSNGGIRFMLGTTAAPSEQMRLTSTGLGIGTSSPATKLDVTGQITTRGSIGALVVQPRDGSGAEWSFYNPTGDDLRFFGNSDDRMVLTNSGNLGLGVTPSAWSQGRAMEFINSGYGFWNGSGSPASMYMLANAYFNGGFKYGGTGQASHYYQYQGAHVWSTAASGTAGNAISFTQAMTLDASGNLGVGTTNPAAYAAKFMLVGSASSQNLLTIQDSGTSYGSNKYYQWFINSAGASAGWLTHTEAQGIGLGSESSLLFYSGGATERARIDSSGNLIGAGTTSIIYWEGVYNNTTASAANMFVASNGSFARSTSALKYKQDIRDLESVDVDLLRPVRYKSKCEGDDQTKDHLGLIADEAADAGFEELVTRGSSGEVEGFQYERLTVVLLKEIQSLRARLAAAGIA
jgi:hypothetical protein